jgi:multidrug efflux system membrane fusion protein
VRADEAAVAMAKINLDYARIVSPITGRVGLRLVDIGNYVQPSDQGGLVVVTQTEPISVIFSLPQDTIPQFLPKLRSGEKLTVEVYSRDGSQKLATGALDTVDNQIDTTTGTVKLRAMFANEDEQLFPNQFVNVKLIVDTLRGATIAPSAAVLLGAPGTYAYVVKSDNTVTVRPVKVGPGNDAQTAILSGLEPGEQVVIDGSDRLREGTTVRIAGASSGAKTSEGGSNQPPRSKQAK